MLELREAIYLVSGSGSFLIGIMLLALKSFPDNGNRTYRTAKKYLAYTAFIDVLIDAMMLYMILKKDTQGLLDVFALPTAYYCQLFFLSFVALTLVRSDINYKRYLKWAIHPLATLFLLFWGGFAVFYFRNSGMMLPLIAGYCRTGWALTISGIIHIILIGGTIGCFVWMSIAARRYMRKVENFYSGDDVEKGSKVNIFILIYFTFFIITAGDMFLRDEALDSTFMIIKSALGTATTIFIFNMSPFFLSTGRKMSGYKINGEETAEDKKQEESIGSAVQRWEDSEDKPYLKEGLVLSDVADELGISYLQLSYYLNHHLGVNFNSWINRLRIGEAKRIIEAEPQTQISDVAYRSGFSDLTIFSRNFKKEEGITASAFRKKISDTAL